MNTGRKRRRVDNDDSSCQHNLLSYSIALKNKVEILEKQNLYLLNEIENLKTHLISQQKKENKLGKKINRIQDNIPDVDFDEFNMRLNFLENNILQIHEILRNNEVNKSKMNHCGYIN